MYHIYDTSMDNIADITSRIKQIKADLAALEDMRPGSLSAQSRRWGGKYHQLSYIHRGKGHTEYVREADRAEVQRQLAAYKRFRALTKEWVDLAMKLCKLKAKSEASDDAT